MSNERRIFGPPGTGKTTYLTRQVRRAAEQFGSAEVMVASFTKTAAQEIAGRDLPLDEQQVGTLHAFAFRALDRPEVAEGKIKAWNEAYPQYALTGNEAPSIDEMVSEQTFGSTGDELYNKAQILRARMTPADLWPVSVQAFQDKWNGWKTDENMIDFTDMIEKCVREVETAPGEPSVGFFDEVQDFTPLELALVRKWGAKMGIMLLAGDDDQAIYGFKGATPDAFLDPPLDADHKRVLSQSHRVPRQVQAWAEAWIQRVTRREPKAYAPKDVEGEVRRLSQDPRLLGANWKNVEPIVLDAQRYIAEGKSVMFLAACGYMLEPLKAVLRSYAMPFHNPYRRRRGDWNPLAASRGTSTSERVLAYFRVSPRHDPFWQPGDREDSRCWTADDLKLWVDLIKADGVLNRGAKKLIEGDKGDYPLFASGLIGQFLPEEFLRAHSLDPDWLRSKLLATKAKTASYPLDVIANHGVEALRTTPQIIIGTIHSVKGGEADVVYLIPDLSRNGYEEWSRGGETRDGVLRLFYVGGTRPKQTLVLCQPASPMAVRL